MDWVKYQENIFDKNGYNACTGLYKSRYYAKKAASEGDVVVKVEGGYRVMWANEYEVWKNQK